MTPAQLEHEIMRWCVRRQQKAAADYVFGYHPKDKKPPLPDGEDLDARCIRAYVMQAQERMREEQKAKRLRQQNTALLKAIAKQQREKKQQDEQQPT